MKKKIALLICCLFLMSSVALASPLTDYSMGKFSIDLNYRNTQNTVSDSGDSIDFGKKYNLEPAFTVGLGNKLAFQYRGLNSKSKDITYFDPAGGGSNVTANSKLTVDEFNVLYQVGSNVSVFAGVVSAKGSANGTNSVLGPFDESSKKNTWQLGLVGSVPLADKFTAYGVLGAGDKYTNYEIGVSYAFTKNLEFNVDYRALKVKDLDDVDAKVKGLGFGVTCKF